MLYSFFLFVNKKKTHILFGFINIIGGYENIFSDPIKAFTRQALFELSTEKFDLYKQQ